MILAYRIIMACHIMAVIFWIAGIFGLYRLFVNHTAETEQVAKDRLIALESSYYRHITMPAMGVALTLGLVMMMMNTRLLSLHWLHLKLALVVLLMGSTHFAGHIRRQLEAGTCPISRKIMLILNAVPSVLMVLIVLLVILHPF